MDTHLPESLTAGAPPAGKRKKEASITAACDLARVVDELAGKLAETARRLNCGDDANVRETLRHYAAEIYLLAERLDYLIELDGTSAQQQPDDG